MLVMGIGLPGTLFFAIVIAWLEVYADDVPSQSQEAWQRPSRPGPRSIKDIVEGGVCDVPQGTSIAQNLSFRLQRMAALWLRVSPTVCCDLFSMMSLIAAEILSTFK